ncbi:Rab-GTPase-TBC domain superfamily [Sesbania bispinosa]|nr:Rab-GTPase-TBC domain superfamily [Sesbania bispinosa]
MFAPTQPKMMECSFNLLHNFEPKSVHWRLIAGNVYGKAMHVLCVFIVGHLCLFIGGTVFLLFLPQSNNHTAMSTGILMDLLQPHEQKYARSCPQVPCAEEEDERSDKWRSFLEQVAKSPQASSSENKHEETLKAESNVIKEEGNPHSVSNGHDSSSRNFPEDAEVEEETNAVRVSEGDDSSGRTSSGGTEIKEEPVEGVPEEQIHEKVCTNETLDGGINGSREENALMDQGLPELLSPWKELESLVQGGVPKDLRGEVWQAFVGVKTRRVESYYDDLLAQEINSDEIKEKDVPSGALGKWRKQIEKVLHLLLYIASWLSP